MTFQNQFIARRLVYLLLITATLFSIYSFYPHSQAHWLIWSGLFLALITLGATFQQRILYLCLTALGGVIAVWLAEFAQFDTATLSAYLLIVTVLCVYYSEIYPRFVPVFFTINLFAMLASCFPFANADANARLLYLGIGFAAAIILQILFWPGYRRFELRSLSRIALQSLQQLNQEIFSCFLQPDYAENKYIYERRLHTRKIKFMQAVLSIADENAAAKLNRLFSLMLDYAQLRARITDYSIFQVCTLELTTLLDEINNFYAKLKRANTFDISTLLNSIQRLEDNYQNVLKVTAKEPLPFALFIASVRAYVEEMEQFD